MNSFAFLVYLTLVIWAITQSTKRWITLLWIISSIAVTIGVFWLLSLMLPYGAAILGHVALPVSMLISGLIGVNHMRANRRISAPKPQ